MPWWSGGAKESRRTSTPVALERLKRISLDTQRRETCAHICPASSIPHLALRWVVLNCYLMGECNWSRALRGLFGLCLVCIVVVCRLFDAPAIGVAQAVKPLHLSYLPYPLSLTPLSFPLSRGIFVLSNDLLFKRQMDSDHRLALMVLSH